MHKFDGKLEKLEWIINNQHPKSLLIKLAEEVH